MIKWKVGKWSDDPEKIEVIKETPKTILYLRESWMGRKVETRSFKSSDNAFFDSYVEAINYKISCYEKQIQAYKKKISEDAKAVEQLKLKLNEER